MNDHRMPRPELEVTTITAGVVDSTAIIPKVLVARNDCWLRSARVCQSFTSSTNVPAASRDTRNVNVARYAPSEGPVSFSEMVWEGSKDQSSIWCNAFTPYSKSAACAA